MASHLRRKKVAERLKQEIGVILLSEIKDPRIGMVSVIQVKVSPDLRSARVYVSVFGDEGEKTKAMAALKHARGFIQTQVARRVDLRFAPILRFFLDESIERSIRVSKILDEITAERESENPDQPDPAESEGEIPDAGEPACGDAGTPEAEESGENIQLWEQSPDCEPGAQPDPEDGKNK